MWLRRSSLYLGAQRTYAAHVPVIPSTGARQLPHLIHYSPVGDSVYLVSALSRRQPHNSPGRVTCWPGEFTLRVLFRYHTVRGKSVTA